MANKIEPNGSPGGQWFNDTAPVKVGSVITTVGIRNNFGNVNQGFDNDGDFAPDYNAWAQPIGDPSYDPSCFRLIRTTGVLTVSRSSGNPDLLIPSQDQLYFMNLPPDNTNVSGNVYYTFLALNGPCQTSVSPYQEVASEYDNEKFNGDYGTSLPPVASDPPDVELDKSGNLTVTPGSRITYTVAYTNNGDEPVGLPLNAMPLVLSDTIPASTTLAGDIEASDFTVLYSTDDGQTYTTTPPRPIAAVTTIQLWYTDSLQAGGSGVVTLSVQVDNNPTGAFIENCVDAQFDSAGSFITDCYSTLISGTNTIGDYVWRDKNTDGIQDPDETGIDDVTVYLYWDDDGDRVLDSDDPLVATTTTAISGTAHGYYLFENLPDGDYLVTVDSDDDAIPYGYNCTTPELIIVELDPENESAVHVNYLDADFGFGPVLTMNKERGSGEPIYEGNMISYTIELVNTRPGDGTGQGSAYQYTVWASHNHTKTVSNDDPESNNTWTNEPYALGAPDGLYATSLASSQGDDLEIGGFLLDPQLGNITGVTATIYVRELQDLANNYLEYHLYIDDNDVVTQTQRYTQSHFSQPMGSDYVLEINLSDVDWDWSHFQDDRTEALLTAGKVQGNPSAEIGVDAIAYAITTDRTYGGPEDTVATLPLTDTYDADRLEFVSALPSEDRTYATTTAYANTGTIEWHDLGPLYAGQTKMVTVTFAALEPGGNATETITNTAIVKNATYYNGNPVNGITDSVTNTLAPTGEIGDLIWRDVDGNGSYDNDDIGIYGVHVHLPADVTITVDGVEYAPGTVVTTTTDANGKYLFEGLRYSGDYTVTVDTTSLPTGGLAYTNTVDKDGAPGDNTTTFFLDHDSDIGEDSVLNADFGYDLPAIIEGTIWNDWNQQAGSR